MHNFAETADGQPLANLGEIQQMPVRSGWSQKLLPRALDPRRCLAPPIP